MYNYIKTDDSYGNIEYDINNKQATITGAATTITTNNLTPNRVLVSNTSGKVAVSSVSSTELDYLDGVTSKIQNQINTLNNKISPIGTVYTPSILTPAHANQETISFGSFELPAGGVYVIVGSAKHSMSGKVCVLSISTSVSAKGEFAQAIYGNVAYDSNAGEAIAIVAPSTNTIYYFNVWAESDFEITPTTFKAVRIV